MKKALLMCMIFASEVTLAQPGSFDVFPLKAGLNFKYRFWFDTRQSSLLDGVTYARTDSGSIEYIVHDSSPSGDTAIVWSVEGRQSLSHTTVVWNKVDTVYSTNDTTFFTVKENTSLHHELDCSSLAWSFPLSKPDTTRPIYRFSDTSTILMTERWTTNTPECGVGTDSLWFSDTTGLVRRKSSAFYGICHNSHSSTVTLIELEGNPTLTVRTSDHLPSEVILDQNFPNPFNPSTTIQYALPRRSLVTLTVYNTLGQQVTTLVNGETDAGYHTVKFDGSHLASGLYFYRLQAGSFVETKKLLLVK